MPLTLSPNHDAVDNSGGACLMCSTMHTVTTPGAQRNGTGLISLLSGLLLFSPTVDDTFDNRGSSYLPCLVACMVTAAAQWKCHQQWWHYLPLPLNITQQPPQVA